MAAPEHRLDPENRLHDPEQDPVYSVYALALEDGCYYVGKSKKVHQRIREHFRGVGAEWTKIHEPKEVELIEDVGDHKDAVRREAELYDEYVERHSSDVVRGAGNTKTTSNNT